MEQDREKAAEQEPKPVDTVLVVQDGRIGIREDDDGKVE